MATSNRAITRQPKTWPEILNQDFVVARMLEMLASGVHPPAMLFEGRFGCGKCLAKGTPVLMFDGTIKAVEDVIVGDRLMGPDSTPRNVLSLAHGREMMYQITPTKGESYTVNESHILSLKMSVNAGGHKAGEVVNLSVRDFLSKSAKFRRTAMGYRVGVAFPETSVPLDPYLLGVWLGDGGVGTSRITTADPEILQEIRSYCGSISGLEVVINQEKSAAATYVITSGQKGGSPKRNAFVNALRSLGIYETKRIPHLYKANSRVVRLNLLAGLIDTDGWYNPNNGYEIMTISEDLADDITYLARSLGFASYKYPRVKRCCNPGYEKTGTYYAVSISGHLDEIPVRLERKRAQPRRQRKDVLVSAIKVEPVGEDEYFGFEIDGDRLFLLGDFTVTHNTATAVLYAMARFCTHSEDGLTPCGRCEACIKVLNNCWEDYLFVDGASSRGIDFVKGTLIPFLTRAPFRSRCKLVVLDEAHSYLEPAQSAFLTTFETLPRTSPDTTVILCTTAARKLLPALRSRCTPFHFQAMPDELVRKLLVKERPDLAAEVIDALLDASEGSLRQAYATLDQIGGQPVTVDIIHQQLGTLTPRERTQLWGHIEAGEAAKLQALWRTLTKRSLDLELVGNQLLLDLSDRIALAPEWPGVVNALHQFGLAQAQVGKAQVQGQKTLWEAALFSVMHIPGKPDLLTPEGIRRFMFT